MLKYDYVWTEINGIPINVRRSHSRRKFKNKQFQMFELNPMKTYLSHLDKL